MVGFIEKVVGRIVRIADDKRVPLVIDVVDNVGRIVRIADDKRVPLVIDVVDNIGLFAGMARTRSKWYKTQVDEVRDQTSNIGYDAVKPSVVLNDWLTEPDPWNK